EAFVYARRPQYVNGEEDREIDDHADDGGRDAGQRAVNFICPCVDSTSGPPARMNRNDGRNVNQVATLAASAPARHRCSGPNNCFAQPPTKPTNATTMIRGPGVVSPSARPSIICGGVSQPKVSTAPCTT